jgi:hypothetical protein
METQTAGRKAKRKTHKKHKGSHAARLLNSVLRSP